MFEWHYPSQPSFAIAPNIRLAPIGANSISAAGALGHGQSTAPDTRQANCSIGRLTAGWDCKICLRVDLKWTVMKVVFIGLSTTLTTIPSLALAEMHDDNQIPIRSSAATAARRPSHCSSASTQKQRAARRVKRAMEVGEGDGTHEVKWVRETAHTR
jgi:hypothetical protein